jgi:hypothetical protein
MEILHRIAERRLEEAHAAGELDDYAGKGQPMQLDDLSRVPEELRAGYILLKSGGFLPEEVEISPSRVEFHSTPEMNAFTGMESEMKEKRFLDLRPK